MARFLYTLRDTDAAPAATNGHDRATLAHAHEFSDRTATTRSRSQDRNTHRAWRNAETTAQTNKHHDRRDNCATNNTTIAETTAEQTTPRSTACRHQPTVQGGGSAVGSVEPSVGEDYLPLHESITNSKLTTCCPLHMVVEVHHTKSGYEHEGDHHSA